MARSKQRNAERCPTHPGAFLREMVLPAMSVSKVDIAAALGVSRQTLYDILAEKQPVTPAMACGSRVRHLARRGCDADGHDLGTPTRGRHSKLHPLPKAS